ncbi:MAG: ABC transporter ATP-binding protein [Rhodocyclales bacterium]|nr:ABC transporter ATP-binding protein [Rhodocyclales bacterium]
MSVIALRGVGKTYVHYEHVLDRLREVVTGRRCHREHVALHPLDLAVEAGEVVGVVGLNGAGKSTLLKLLANTLQPSMGRLEVRGRVSALLELGAGFHPEMSGRDNVYLSGAVMGLTREQVDALYDSIVDFAGIADFMGEPVKNYSSGMFVRLAFSVATCVTPDVLIVDEALSVGDGIFARKSFDRIMQFKQAGKTIFFCSHSLYQVEALCDRAVWIHEGRVREDGPASVVVAAYNGFLGTPGGAGAIVPADAGAGAAAVTHADPVAADGAVQPAPGAITARLLKVEVEVDGVVGRRLQLTTHRSNLAVRIRFVSDAASPVPTVAVALTGTDGRMITSAGSLNDQRQLLRDTNGVTEVTLSFPRLALLKGRYAVNIYLLCERGIHCYEEAAQIAEIEVSQEGLEQGVVSLPHEWAGSVES